MFDLQSITSVDLVFAALLFLLGALLGWAFNDLARAIARYRRRPPMYQPRLRRSVVRPHSGGLVTSAHNGKTRISLISLDERLP